MSAFRARVRNATSPVRSRPPEEGAVCLRGWLVGWVLVAVVPAARHRPRSLLAGALVWVAVVVVGMLVRGGLVGDGVQTSFVVVTTIVLAVFLLGWYVYYLMTGSFGFGLGDRG